MTEEDKAYILSEQAHIQAGIKILKDDGGFSEEKISELLSQRSPTGINKSTLNKYKNADTNILQLAIKYCKLIVKALDLLIIDTFQKEWDQGKKQYVEVKKDSNEINAPTRKSGDLQKLSGIWIGHSWNAHETNVNRTPYLNVFKIQINSENVVHLKIEKGKFTGGKVSFIGINKIELTFRSDYRKIHIFGEITLIENLEELKEIPFAYIDTGVRDIKCGLAIMKRAKNVSYDSIETNSLPATKSGLDAKTIQFLRKTQHIARLQ